MGAVIPGAFLVFAFVAPVALLTFTVGALTLAFGPRWAAIPFYAVAVVCVFVAAIVWHDAYAIAIFGYGAGGYIWASRTVRD